MSSRRLKSAAVIAPVVLFLLVGCAQRFSPAKPISAKTFVPTYNSISGRAGNDGPVLVVKIDDTRQAHPQIGIDSADLVYIEQVEAGLTRLAAVFSSSIPTRIGPVRSARISDMDILAQYGHVAFAYSGAQTKLLPVIASANLENLGAQRESPTVYPRDPSRIPPVDLVLRADLLMQKILNDGKTIAKSKAMGWIFGDVPAGGRLIDLVTMKWPNNAYSARWSMDESRWLLFHAGVPDLADDGKQLGASTLVIQKVSITDSVYKDKFGGVTPFSATIGSGSGYILRDGKVFAAIWKRPTAESGTSWTTADGTPLNFARGQIWVALLAQEPEFTFPAPTVAATRSPSPAPTK